MRKLLLATAAVLSGSMGVAQIASAQTAVPNYSLGTGMTVQSAAPVPTPYGGGGAPFTSYPSPVAGPGTITVRLNARINVYEAAGADSGRNASVVTTAASATAGPTISGTNTKLANYTFLNYMRFYPGFDGIAANGLKYGGAAELRQDNGEPAGGGANGSISQDSRNQGTFYSRVAYVYLGTDQAGFLRLGTTYGASTLHITGTFENFNDGAWNGDLGAMFTANTQPTWPFPDVGAIYATQKVVYVSPSFFGVDFAASFEPNSSAGGDTNGNCNYNNSVAGTVTGPVGTGAGSSCYATSASTVVAETARRRDTGEVSVRYRGAFGPVGVAANVAYIAGSKVFNDNSPAIKATQTQYDALSMVDAGAVVTFGGLTAGGNILNGHMNGQYNLQPKGGREAFAYVVGASYALGPIIVGGSFYDYMSAGNRTALTSPWVGNRDEYGVAAGGTYTFAPGMNIFLSYLYGHRKEAGVDLLSGVNSVGTTLAGRVYTHNNVQSQGISIGTQFRW